MISIRHAICAAALATAAACTASTRENSPTSPSEPDTVQSPSQRYTNGCGTFTIPDPPHQSCSVDTDCVVPEPLCFTECAPDGEGFMTLGVYSAPTCTAQSCRWEKSNAPCRTTCPTDPPIAGTPCDLPFTCSAVTRAMSHQCDYYLLDEAAGRTEFCRGSGCYWAECEGGTWRVTSPEQCLAPTDAEDCRAAAGGRCAWHTEGLVPWCDAGLWAPCGSDAECPAGFVCATLSSGATECMPPAAVPPT